MIYTCAECGKEFEGGWSDEEARAEARQNFPTMDLNATDPDDPFAPVIVCDGCFRAIMGPSGVVQ